MLDVVTLGETQVRFSPKGYLRLDQAHEMEVNAAGAESNVAVALARLGMRTGWISKLPDHPLSRLIVGEIRRHGVDTSRVVWTTEGRVATYFFERAVPPRPPRVWYDRKGSTVTTLRLPSVSILFCGRADAEQVFGLAGEPEAVARAFREKFGIPTVVLTLGAQGSLALADRVHRQQRVHRVEMVDPLGAGDAFAAGFLCGYLEDGVQRGLDLGGSTAALDCTIVGDAAFITRAEVEELLTSEDQEIQR